MTTVFDRFKPGEETPYNGGVVHSCKTCGAVVDMHDLAVHDEWHRNLHKETTAALKEDMARANARLLSKLHGLPALGE